VYGLRTSLFIAVAATAIATTIGVVAGLVSGYSGGWLDNFTSRVADVFLALPIVLVAISGRVLTNLNPTPSLHMSRAFPRRAACRHRVSPSVETSQFGSAQSIQKWLWNASWLL